MKEFFVRAGNTFTNCSIHSEEDLKAQGISKATRYDKNAKSIAQYYGSWSIFTGFRDPVEAKIWIAKKRNIVLERQILLDKALSEDSDEYICMMYFKSEIKKNNKFLGKMLNKYPEYFL